MFDYNERRRWHRLLANPWVLLGGILLVCGLLLLVPETIHRSTHPERLPPIPEPEYARPAPPKPLDPCQMHSRAQRLLFFVAAMTTIDASRFYTHAQVPAPGVSLEAFARRALAVPRNETEVLLVANQTRVGVPAPFLRRLDACAHFTSVFHTTMRACLYQRYVLSETSMERMLIDAGAIFEGGSGVCIVDEALVVCAVPTRANPNDILFVKLP